MSDQDRLQDAEIEEKKAHAALMKANAELVKANTRKVIADARMIERRLERSRVVAEGCPDSCPDDTDEDAQSVPERPSRPRGK